MQKTTPSTLWHHRDAIGETSDKPTKNFLIVRSFYMRTEQLDLLSPHLRFV